MAHSTITCADVEPVWKVGRVSPLVHRTDIWSIKMPEGYTVPAAIEQVLSGDENQTASRFFQVKDRQNFMIRRGVLRILLSEYLGCTASDITFKEGPNKKPEILLNGDIQIHFNISHSAGRALIAISDSEVGVDVEEFKPEFQYKDLLHHGFSQAEIEFISQSAIPQKAFFLLWARKESIIKATAKGVDDDLDKIPALDGIHTVPADILGSIENLTVRSFYIEDTHQGSIANVDYNTSINFLNFPIDNYLA